MNRLIQAARSLVCLTTGHEWASWRYYQLGSRRDFASAVRPYNAQTLTIKIFGRLTMKKYCDGCGVSHSSIMCFKKPRRPLRFESDKAYNKRTKTTREWYRLNPPNERGLWPCYLRISVACPTWITESMMQLEHVRSKARHKHLQYVLINLMPACDFCNKLKGSLDIEDLITIYPQMNHNPYIIGLLNGGLEQIEAAKPFIK